MIRKIGLTGGIASGKSQVAEILTDMLGCIRIDADLICRQLLEPDADGWQEFSRVFGTKYFTEDGRIDRVLLRKDLFSDTGFRRQVNNLIHPLVKKSITDQMESIVQSDPSARLLVEVPLLYEVGWENLFDTVIVVFADYEICLKRLMERDGVQKTVAAKELESQMPLSEKVLKADHVIDNSGMLSDTVIQVEHLVSLLNKNDDD